MSVASQDQGNVVTLHRASAGSPPPIDFDTWLVTYIARMPMEDITDQFQRGYLCALLSCYEARGLPLNDARYLAGQRLAARMASLAFSEEPMDDG